MSMSSENLLLILPFVTLVFSSCVFGDGDTEKTLATAILTVESVKLTDMPNLGNVLDFEIYVERPDLNIQQPYTKNPLLTESLPEALQPEKLAIVGNNGLKDFELGEICELSTFPHKCTVRLLSTVENVRNQDYLTRIDFVDGSYTLADLTIPVPEMIDRPEIVYPLEEPESGELFKIGFKDVGAKRYRVDVLLCNIYNNDGINPCLDGIEYEIVNADGTFVSAENDESFPLKINSRNGFITIQSDYPLEYDDSIEYTISAINEDVLENGIKTTSQVFNLKSFY